MPKNTLRKPLHEKETILAALGNDMPLGATIRRFSIQARYLASLGGNTELKGNIQLMLVSGFYTLKWLSEFENNSCREQFLDALINFIMQPEGVKDFLSLSEIFLKDD